MDVQTDESMNGNCQNMSKWMNEGRKQGLDESDERMNKGRKQGLHESDERLKNQIMRKEGRREGGEGGGE